MILLHPPLTKPCEPPAALAYLQGALESRKLTSTVCDLNIEGITYLLQTSRSADDTWSKRAFKNVSRNIEALQNISTYQNRDRYRRAVADINRVLEMSGQKSGIDLSLANYQDSQHSPLKSGDLKMAAANFEKNIFFPYFQKRLKELLHIDGSNSVGISINYLSQALCAFAIIGFLKKHYPHLQIIVGGGLITTWLSHPHWNDPFKDLIDVYIGGKGEQSLLGVLGKTSIDKKNYFPLYRDLKHNAYLSPGFILPYAASSGCFWKKCNFCPEKSEDNPYNLVPPQRTLSELEALSRETEPAIIHLLDNAISPSTLKALTKSSLQRPWYGFARFDTLLTRRDFCRQLKESGCVMLKLGLESGDQAVLDAMQKGINLTRVATILENLEAVGIGTYIYLLFGTPAESRKSAEATLSFVEQYSQAIQFLNLAIFNLPIYSSEMKNLIVSDFYDGDLSIYQNFVHPGGWNRKEVRSFLDSSFRKRPKIAAILKNDPPLFTSNHAPFLV